MHAEHGRRATPAGTGFAVVQAVTLNDPHRWQRKTDPYLYHAAVEVGDGRQPASGARL
jgi:beta-galactosidase/beta-glucuronidase